MGVVTRKMLHRHMSEPRWTTGQEAEADRLVVAVEVELSAALYGAPITPVPRNEVVQVSREGMVATSLPVVSVSSLNGVAVSAPPDDTPPGAGQTLPEGYTLRGHRVWTAGVSTAVGYGVLGTFELSRGARWRAPDHIFESRPVYSGYSVAVVYMGGWGAEPALVEAILRKAALRMAGRHSDTVVIGGLNAQAANRAIPESAHFTEDDLRVLGRYRALGWGPG